MPRSSYDSVTHVFMLELGDKLLAAEVELEGELSSYMAQTPETPEEYKFRVKNTLVSLAEVDDESNKLKPIEREELAKIKPLVLQSLQYSKEYQDSREQLEVDLLSQLNERTD